jgi:RHS repeat-associated protein
MTDRAGNVTSFSYDLLLRRDRIRGSLNQPAGPEKVTAFDRLGRLQSRTDEAGNVTTTAYDIFNQALNVTLPDHTAGSPRIQTLTYNAYGQLLTQSGAGDYPVTCTYDLAGNRLTLVTQYGAENTNQTTTWAYDSRNRVNRKTYADNTFYDYTYDENGNLKTRTDAKNQTTSYSYNLFNQVTTVDYPADSDVSFTCDASGRRLSMTDGSRSGAPSTEWTYDAAGRIATYKQHPVDRIIRYGYNAEGGRTSMSVEKISAPGDPWTTAYTYDAAGRLDTLTDSRVGEIPFEYTWDPKANLVKEILMPSGAKQQKTYDALARLSEIKALHGSGGTVNRYAYTYDAAGQRKDVTLADNGKITYGYDAKRQVTSAVKDNEADYNYSYTFDNIGNWLTGKTGQTSGVPLSKSFTPNSLNQYSQVSSVTLTYDANGNLTHDGANTYTYDQENRLAAVAGASFTYDGLSRRVGSGATKFLYDGVVPIAELDAANHYTRTVTRGLDLANTFQETGGIGGILATISGVAKGYYFYDGNGNVVDVLDDSHSVIAHYAYDPFGNKVVENGSYAAQPYQWSTKEFDAASGLVYYLYRFYAPQIGRWPSRDPIGEKGGLNLYGFLGNDGVDRLDVLGMACCDLPDGQQGPPAPYNETTHCCCKGAILSRAFIPVGVTRCQNFKKQDDLTPTHAWLEFPGGSAGFWPNGDPFGGLPGKINSPDPYADGSKKQNNVWQEEILVNQCDVDVDKFISCLQSSGDSDGGNYTYGFRDCRHWSKDRLNACTKQAKRECK